ncbi:MAG: hypothetical protein QOD75_2474 [Blastocatellia bacterium]|jgi:hypothetical protein|nr:hypothetical protein [Blastocatellia bacterium]
MINPQRSTLNSDSLRLAKSSVSNCVVSPRQRLLARLVCLFILIAASPLLSKAQTPIPILVSEATSTRAVALESVTFTPEPFATISSHSWNADHKTRVMLFALNLSLQPGETLLAVTADAEDGAHRFYNLPVEYLGPVPDQPSLTAVVLILSSDFNDPGDLLVRVFHQGIASNRVRLAIGHKGGGPADDVGAGPTPAPPYAISGTVTESGLGISGVMLSLSEGLGGPQNQRVTGGTGAYQFSVAAAGGNYTLTPAKTFYDFSPSSRTFSNLSNNQSNNFIATRQAHNIAGVVRDEAGQGLDGLQVTLTSAAGTNIGTTITANGGNYSFANLPAGFGYTVTPANTNVFTFELQSTSPLTSDLTFNFNGLRRSYAISGRITDGGNGLAGVRIALNGSTAATTTDALGNYSFANLPAGVGYTVTPANTNVFRFTPQITSALTTNLTFNFDGQRRVYTISGRITEGANGLAGVRIALNGSTAATTTDALGNYSFANLPAGFGYTVTPANTNVFTFEFQSTSLLTSDLTLNFDGLRRSYAISGRITDGTKGLAGWSVAFSGSQVLIPADAAGYYVRYVPAGYSYTVTPQNSGVFTFTSQTTQPLTSDVTLNFTGQRRAYTIGGRIADGPNGLPGINVALNGSQATTTTDAGGNYSFTNVTAGFDYIVTPSRAHYTFTPGSLTFNNLSNNQQADFNGLLRYHIAGRMVDDAGLGLAGVTMTIGGSQSTATFTSADGSYSFAVPPGSYTLTPSIEQNWFTFSPASQTFNNLTDDQTTDFLATATQPVDEGYVLEFDGTPKTVYYGPYWDPDVDLGHFFWEFWAMPGNHAGATYLLSDGYGGAHALLFGFANLGSSEPGRYEFIGDIFDGVTHQNYFRSDQGPAPGEWGHFAVGWDGQNITTYLNGVPVGKTPFRGPRRTPGPAGGGGWLFMGGSNHNNFDGRIAQLRGYEVANPREDPTGVDKTRVESSFAPQTVFNRDGNLLSYYFRPAPTVADLSNGYAGQSHPGILLDMLNGFSFSSPGNPTPEFVIDPTAPNFAAGTAPAPVNVANPPAVPTGARIFDSFSRPNVTLLFNGQGGLGVTEGGSAGTKAWQINQGNSLPFGILNGRAVMLGNDISLTWVTTGSISGNLDTRVDRHAGTNGSGLDTGLCFRVLNGGSFFFAYTSAGAVDSDPRRLAVGYYVDGQRVNLASAIVMPASWTTLRAVTKNSGELAVYADGALLYSTSNSTLAQATGSGLYNNSRGLGLVNRWDNFTVYNAP